MLPMMLRSVWTIESRTARRMLGAALSLMMCMRVLIVPGFAADLASGLVSLCAGGEVIWVAAGGVAPVEDGKPRIPCPWLALSATPQAPVTPVPERRLAPVPARHAQVHAQPGFIEVQFPRQSPRAPPRSRSA